MENLSDYILPVTAIRHILLKEHHNWYKFNDIGLHDYLRYALDLVMRKIESLQTYDDVEVFIQESRRMTLKEWIETL